MDQTPGSVAALPADPDDRKRRGAWYTPPDLVEQIVAAVVTPEFVARTEPARPIRVLDPACGDGRFLAAVEARLAAQGRRCELTGLDIDERAAAAAMSAVPGARIVCGDALSGDWDGERFDLVLGNPPFLSQLAADTTRGRASRLGGGPYADAAVEFLALAERVVGDGGRVAFVLPQSALSARDATEIRERYDTRARMIWSWWTGERIFDAQVLTCAVAFDFGTPPNQPARSATRSTWGHVVTDRRAIPVVPELAIDGTLGERAWLNANFRDEYYGMVPAVGDHEDGPPLVTSGLIDPAVSLWGRRAVRFARRRYDAPRIDVDALDDRMRRWAERRLVPKVLVANQTRIVEAVCDPDGEWLPGVPVVGVYPHDGTARSAWAIAAVLTSPVPSAWVWHRSAGTGLSADSIRLGPVVLADLPWPAGSLEGAVDALRHGDLRRCGALVDAAYGIADDGALMVWWTSALERFDARRPERSTGP